MSLWFTILRRLVLATTVFVVSVEATSAAELTVVVDGQLLAPSQKALAGLESSLKSRGIEVRRSNSLSDKAPRQIVLGTVSSSPLIKSWLEAKRIDLPDAAESLCIKQLDAGQTKAIVIAGRDERGLSYALWDLARHVDASPKESDPFESPAVEHRSVAIHLFNKDLEEDWYFDETFWKSYFTMLASNRFNAFSLTFADHTNYLNPPYPFLVESPEFPGVQVADKNFTAAERTRNLQMLKTISDLAADHGITFIFSVWMQKSGIKRDLIGESLVNGIPNSTKDHADFCGRGLTAVLKACPNIGGVQFRMNDESGVPAAKQKEFFSRQFRSIAECGRPIQLDLRLKGLLPETTDAAVDMGLDVSVSTKFWTEHTGLPFHATESDPRHRWGRYGYADMLDKTRRYKTFFRLWTCGTQRLLQWGDPEYVAHFAQSCKLSGSRGFEIFALPANKGYGNRPGKWPILVDPTYVHGRWEHEKCWAYYLAYGRAGYAPDGWQAAWDRELRLRFGDAGEAVGRAYRAASRVLPILNAARLDSASVFTAWPEMSPGPALRDYVSTIPSDTGLFYGIRKGKSSEFAYDGPGYVDVVTRGQLRSKWTPFDVATHLEKLADQTTEALGQARDKVAQKDQALWKITELDLEILSNLARFHAGKMRAGTHVELFHETRQAGRLSVALRHIKAAAAAWQRIAERTDGVYNDKLRFLNVDGHWKDRLPLVREDVRLLEQLLQQHAAADQSFPKLPGEEPLLDPPVIEHEPVTRSRSDKDLKITVKVTSHRPLARVILLHRPVNQKLDWKEVEMQPVGGDFYEAAISHVDLTARFDHLYRVEALLTSGGGTLWPSWQKRDPYVVVTVKND